MGEQTGIEWTDHTFNPWWGCAHVSPGCVNCYAETLSKRYGNDVWGKGGKRRFFGDKHWEEPLKWNRKAESEGVRRRVFCGSMMDVFEDRPDLEEPRARLWRLIHDTPHLDWLLLTKRPENVPELAAQFMRIGLPLNVWLGTSVEDQRRADERIPALLELPAAVHFLSCEPLLGPVNIEAWNAPGDLDWVIVGGESGPKARPMHPEWARSLRDQCFEAGIAFFFKQWGAWVPEDTLIASGYDGGYHGLTLPSGETLARPTEGKKAAGRLLDGQEWSEWPASPAGVVPEGRLL